MGVGVIEHVIWAHQLEVVGGEDDATFTAGFLAPLDNLQDDGRRQLVVEVVQVADMGLEVLQHCPHLAACFNRIDGPYGIGELVQFGGAVKIHVRCVGTDPVANAAAIVLHAEELHLVAHGRQRFTQTENIGFAASVGMKELVDHQYAKG